MVNKLRYIVLLSLFVACTDDTDDTVTTDTALLLSTYIDSETVQADNVIACASGAVNPNEIIAYVYPRPGATDIRYFETETVDDDKNDYTAYSQVVLPEVPFFNGYLRSFTREAINEKWVIISFRESGQIHLSNPIRLRHRTQNTVFTDAINLDQQDMGMPRFEWPNLTTDADAIYFQVVSDATNELLSGTYTFETHFQYYVLDNVILNITEESPPDLISGDNYGITLMGVSEDNWVNVLGQDTFTAQ